MEPVRHRPQRATRRQWAEHDRRGPGARPLGAVVADGRRGAHHDEVLGPGGRLRHRGGGHLPRHPAGRRGAAHAVLRALPGRGRRRPGGDRRPRRRARASSSRPPSRQIFDEALVQAHERLVAAPGDQAAKVDFVTTLPPGHRGHARADRVQLHHRYLEREALLPGFVEGYSKIHHDEQRHIGYGTWFLREARPRRPGARRRRARDAARRCCPRSPSRSRRRTATAPTGTRSAPAPTRSASSRSTASRAASNIIGVPLDDSVTAARPSLARRAAAEGAGRVRARLRRLRRDRRRRSTRTAASGSSASPSSSAS